MGHTAISNKRRRTPLIDNKHHLNVIDTTLLTVEYNKEAYARLKKEIKTTSFGIIRKCCSVLMAKMSELSSMLTLNFQSFENAHLLCA